MAARTWTRRGLLHIATLAGAGAVLAACQPKVVEKEVVKEVTKVVEVTAAAPKGTPVIRFTTDWYGGVRGELTNQFLSEWKDKVHPDVSIAYEPCPRVQDRLRVEFAAGTQPDVMYFVPELFAAYGNQLLVLEDFYAQADSKWKDDVWGWNELYRVNGKRVSVPYHHFLWSPMINVDLFKKAGVPMPWEYKHKDKWWNWDDFVESCRAIDRLGEDIYGYDIGGNSTYMQWGPWIMTNGGKYIDPEYPAFGQRVVSGLSTPASVEAFKFVASMHCDTKIAIPVDLQRTLAQSLQVSPFYAGKIGAAQTTSEAGIIKAKMNAHRVVMPRSPRTGTGYNQAGSHPHVASAKTKYPQACWDFMVFLDSSWAQKLIGQRETLPGLKSLLNAPDYYKEFPPIAREALLTGINDAAGHPLPGAFQNFEEWRHDVEAIAMDMMLCKIPADQAIAEMEKTAVSVLARSS